MTTLKQKLEKMLESAELKAKYNDSMPLSEATIEARAAKEVITECLNHLQMHDLKEVDFGIRIFPEPNLHNFKCILCDTAKDEPVVLVPISGTEDGDNIQAMQVHLKCIGQGLMYYPEIGKGFLISSGVKKEEDI